VGIAADDDQGIEVESGTLLAVHLIIPIGIKCIVDAIGVFAVGCKGNDIGGDVQHQAGGGVEQVPPEVEDQGGEYEHDSPLIAVVAYHIRQPLVKEGRLINNERTDCGIVGQHLLQPERVPNLGDIPTTTYVPVAITEGILRILGKACAIDFGTDEEHLAPVHFTAAGQLPDPLTLLLGNGGIPPDAGCKFCFPGAHGPYQQDPSSGQGKIKMGERIVDIQGRKAQALEKIRSPAFLLNSPHAAPLRWQYRPKPRSGWPLHRSWHGHRHRCGYHRKLLRPIQGRQSFSST